MVSGPGGVLRARPDDSIDEQKRMARDGRRPFEHSSSHPLWPAEVREEAEFRRIPLQGRKGDRG